MRDFGDVVEEIKYKTDIAQIISEYVSLKPTGSGFTGLCPFHNEKTPSFHVHTDNQFYKCFGCGESGDVITFIMKIENMEFKEALKFLGDRLGIDTTISQRDYRREDYEEYQKFLEIQVEAARFFYKSLRTGSSKAYDYIIGRGIDESVLNSFGIGYAPASWDSLLNYLKSKGYSEEELEKSKLFKRSKKNNLYDVFRNRLIFPIFDYRGNVIAFGGRVLDDSMPKYLNSPESKVFSKKNNLYGLNIARKNIKNRKIILCEGYMDLITLNQYGFKNVVATLGTALTKNQSLLIKKYADEVIICYDSDDAGISAAIRAIDILLSGGISPKVIKLENAKDPDEFLKKFGSEKFRHCLENADSHLKFKIDRIASAFNLEDDAQKVDFVRKASEVLTHNTSPVEVDVYSKYIADYAKVNGDSVKNELRNISKNSNAVNAGNYNNYNNIDSYNNYNKKQYKPFDRKKQQKTGSKPVPKRLASDKVPEIKKVKYNNSELEIIKVLIEKPDLRDKIILKLDEDCFSSPDSKKIFNFFVNGGEMGINSIDSLKGVDISASYLSDFARLSSKMPIIDIDSIDFMINMLKKSHIKKEIENYSEIQNKLEMQKSSLTDEKEKKEVEKRIMDIVIKIIELNKKLKSV